MPTCSFVIDAPVTLASGDAPSSRVQIAKTGRFKDPRYGEFSITRGDFARWMQNFRELSVADDRAGLPVDVDHGPEKRGDTEAAGWITALDTQGPDGKTPTPGELWAVVEWNTLGADLIRDRRYRYLSPSYQHDFKDEHGRSHGTALVGVGLTNRPFLTMATVSLSAAPLLADELEPAEDQQKGSSDSRGAMALPKNIAEALGLSDDASDDQALEAITALQARPESQKTLDQLAQEDGKVVLSATDFASLSDKATAGANAAEQLREQRFEVAWGKALSATKVTPSQEESFKALYKADADATLSALEALPAGRVSTEAKGHNGKGSEADSAVDRQLSKDAEGMGMDDDRVELHTRTVALMAEHNIDYGTALVRAAGELGVA